MNSDGRMCMAMSLTRFYQISSSFTGTSHTPVLMKTPTYHHSQLAGSRSHESSCSIASAKNHPVRHVAYTRNLRVHIPHFQLQLSLLHSTILRVMLYPMLLASKRDVIVQMPRLLEWLCSYQSWLTGWRHRSEEQHECDILHWYRGALTTFISSVLDFVLDSVRGLIFGCPDPEASREDPNSLQH